MVRRSYQWRPKMIPENKNYIDTKVDPAHSRADVESMLEKHHVHNFAWKREDPENSYLLFEKKFKEMQKSLIYKVQIPFIEKYHGQGYKKHKVYDEKRSYRFFFHIFKSMLLNADIGMEFEMIFSNYLVIGKLPDGTPMTIQDKVGAALVQNKNPALEFTGQ